MNIAIDIRCLQEKQLTGVGEYTLNLLNHLFSIDKYNQYYLFANSSKKIELPKFDFPNVQICRFFYPNKLLNLSLWLFKKPKLDLLIQKKLKSLPLDLFFFPNLNFFSTKCPYIITCHDLSFEIFPNFFSLKQRIWHQLIKPVKIFHHAKSVICVSKNTANDLINQAIGNSSSVISEKEQPENPSTIQNPNILTIYPGIARQFRKLESDDSQLHKVRQKYQLPRNFIFYLGTIEPRKNIETLIKAFEIYKKTDGKDFHLIIAGKIGFLAKKILKQISDSSAKNHISIINYVDATDKVYLYNLAKLFIFPSYYEGFGFPPLEALACGTPTIISHTSSLIEVCGESAIAIDPYNINDLAEAIQVSLSESENLQPKSSNWHVKYDWEKTARQTQQIFTNISK
jgi:glycosyltransferase involved in cell wall biosynthesis